MSSTPPTMPNPPTFPEEAHFDGTNFAAFRDRVLIAARTRGARGYLDGTITDPRTAKKSGEQKGVRTDAGTTEHTAWTSQNPTAEEWDARDAWALSLIINNCKNPIGLGIKMSGTAADAWKALTDGYGTVSTLAAMGAENWLRATMYADGADFAIHLADLCTRWQDAVEKGAVISDETFRTIVMNSLPESWNTIVASLYDTPTSAKLIASLTVHWERLRTQKMAAGVTTTALQANAKPQRSRLVCTNMNCKRTGHTIEACYWLGGGREGQFPQSFRNRDAALATLATAKAAHKAHTAPTPPTVALANMSASHVSYALMAHIDPISHDYNSDRTTTTPVEALAVRIPGFIPTYANSGASDHCFVERHAFSDYEALSAPREGQSAPVGGLFRIIGQGTVKKVVKTAAGTSELVFCRALHTPDLAANLISVGKFDEAGFTVVFTGGKAIFCDAGGREVLVGRQEWGMYLLGDLGAPTGAGVQAMAASLISRPADIDL